MLPRIATPFGAGLGREGHLCGVVAGSLMALGILIGRDSAEEKIGPVYRATGDFVKKFDKRFGSLACRELTGYDPSNPVQLKLMAVKKVKEKTCAGLMEWAVDELKQYLPKSGPG